jgi:PAS domain S-box-containing protein
MLNSIRKLLTPPVFEDDEKTRLARIVHNVLWVSLLGIGVFLILSLTQDSGIATTVMGVSVALILASLALLYRGYLTFPSLVVPLTGLAAVTLILITGSGIHGVSMMGYAVVLATASLLLGRRGAVLLGGLIIAAGFGVIYGEVNGLIVNRFSSLTVYSDFFFFAPLIAMTSGILYVLVNSLVNSAERARQGERALTKSNRELEALRDTLEERVAARTRELEETQTRTGTLLTQLAEASRLAALANFELELDTQTLVFSDRFYELLGTTAEAEGGYRRPIAEAVQNFAHPGDAERVIAEVQALFGSGSSATAQLEYRVIRSDGAIRHFSFRFQVERDAAGNAVRAQGAVQDITDRKLAEQNLREREEDLNALVEFSPEAIGLVNTQTGLFENVNAMAERLFGLPRAELQKVGPAQVSPDFQPDGRPSIEAAMERIGEALAGGAPVFEWMLRDAAGRSFPCEVRLVGLTGQRSHLVRFSVTDITARKQAQAAVAKRATELETVTQLATSITALQDPQEMLQTVVDLVKPSFNLYHAHIYLLDEAGGTLVLTVGAGNVGREMAAQKRAIALAREHSLVARAARSQQAVIANDVSKEPDFLPNPLLPDTRSELAVPLVVGAQVLGVLDVQSDEVNHFTTEDARVQTILASQIATALQNARSLDRSEKAVQELDALTRRLTREGWQAYLERTSTDRIGYMYEDAEGLRRAEPGQAAPDPDKAIARPITVHSETIGQLVAVEAEKPSPEVAAILDAVAQGLSTHIENLRLSEQTQTALAETEDQARRLSRLNELGEDLNRANTMEEILQAVAAKVGDIVHSDRSSIILPTETGDHYQTVALSGETNFDPAEKNYPVFPLAGTTAEMALKQKRLVVVIDPDLSVLPGMSRFVERGLRSFMNAPLITGGNVIGTLNVASVYPNAYAVRDENLLLQVASLMASALENRRLLQQTQRRAEREAMINQITQRIQSAVTVEGALQTALRELGTALKAQRASVALKLAEGNGDSAGKTY